MIAAGVFHPEARLELIEGEILEMTPQGSRHAVSVQLVQEALRVACGPDHHVRVQMPLALDETSEPEPDVAVVAGVPRDYRDAHPVTAALAVEVSEASVTRDRDRKKALYAQHAIQEYWILNLPDRLLEVYRDPADGDYRDVLTLRAGDAVSPLACPKASIPVADLLP